MNRLIPILLGLALLAGCSSSEQTGPTATANTTNATVSEVSEREHEMGQLNQEYQTSPQVGMSATNETNVRSGAFGPTSVSESHAQTWDTSPEVAVTTGGPESADGIFALEAALAGMKEVQFGELAQAKSASPQVKQFARQMVTDHSKANAELKAQAGRLGLTLPGQDLTNSVAYADLARLSGTSFDKQYAAAMVTDHEKAVALFEKESAQGTDSQLKSWAQAKLPTLRHHLEMARALNK